MSVAEGWLLPAIVEHYNRLDSLCESWTSFISSFSTRKAMMLPFSAPSSPI
jgi:hypothetical protein